MLKNSSDIKKQHKRFVCDVVKSGIVSGLQSDEGWASSSSNSYENENGEPENIICFWSDGKRARVCQKKYWPNYAPQEIILSSFMENWLTGMDQDGSIAGTNFDWNLFGFEALPLNLIIELFDEINNVEKTLNFSKYQDQNEFEKLAREIFEQYKAPA
ncbi:DUF2750 domain-containing protein [Hellea balneolensis]|uniref:DUF2750 domain-containing protein n=1 Tax=Hellea balneolensis TaxID=287478 RepID=UPI00047C5563|nr:DUF2750 domain-containing protein [Hellea balneolensis]